LRSCTGYLVDTTTQQGSRPSYGKSTIKMTSEGAPLGFSDFFTDFGSHSAAEAASLSTMASAMLFGCIIFTSVSLATRSYMTGDIRAILAARSPKSKPLNITSFTSVYSLLHHLTVLGMILLYAYICEYHPPFPHSAKSYDRDEFAFLTILLIIASIFSWRHNDPDNDIQQVRDPGTKVIPAQAATDVLNRDQTEEWKGWMQFMFLLYHYHHAEEVYNLIRILITCYVWMTGFGNFSFFYLKGDYGIVRLLQMLWRLNFLVVCLCLTQGTTYILYYICLLHTYYFLVTYATMRIASHVNHSKWGIRFKLAIVAVIIFLVWDVDTGFFRLIHYPFLSEKPMLGAASGSMWEWYFRSSLDHWSTYLGMIFALNYPITSLFYRKLEQRPLVWEILTKGIVGAALVGASYVWVTGPFMQNKTDYNLTNAYFGFIPLITYIYLRNLTPYLRSYSMELLHQLGKTTLETYLMQHHIWLTSNAKSLLTLVPGWPKVNFLVVTIIYYLVARRLHVLTLYLRGIVMPDNPTECLRNTGIVACILFAFYALAFSLDSLGWMNLTAVGIVAISGGLALYKVCLDMTWDAFKASALAHRKPSVEDQVLDKMAGPGASEPKYDSPISVFSAPLVGFLVVFTLGLTWHGMAQVGAAPIGPLPEGCEAFANQGTWIPVDPCSEETRGMGYREYGISSFATCAVKSNTYVWGWNDTDPSSHCRFHNRDAKSLRKELNHRTITFVGDSVTRHVYHATLRQMGMAGAGAYNTKVPKWSDITNTIGDTTMEFEWAALAKDQVVKIRDIIARPDQVTGDKSSIRPDLVVMGGGAWDRLHVYATDEDRESHRATVKELAKEIRLARSAGIPVVWIVPTTINSKALLTEEKQKNIKEDDMASIRALYDNLGVTEAASFVLDGPSWTEARVSESYDGVHYPLAVYDAGAQILANAMDWILPDRDTLDPFNPPKPGSMSNPPLGLMILCFVFMGLFCFDGFMGFSYLGAFFVKGVMPSDLSDEAFDEIKSRIEHPEPQDDVASSFSIGMVNLVGGRSTARTGGGPTRTGSIRSGTSRSGAGSLRSGASGRSSARGSLSSSVASGRSGSRSHQSAGQESASSSQGSIDDEIAALLGSTSRKLDLDDEDFMNT
jgi:hypothetical protein